MIIKIGTTIKELRLRKKVTQEQLATFLGVTPQAISRWEAGNGYPGVENLPMIADFFGVTTDELFGVCKEERKSRLDAIYKEIDRMHEECQTSNETLQFVRNAVSEFPSEVKLQVALANEICCLYMWEPCYDRAKLKEAERIYETVIETCCDTEIKNQVLENLCALYAVGYKDEEKAIETAERLPQMKFSREAVLATCLCNYDTGIYYLQNYIDILADSLGSSMLDCIVGVKIPNERETWEEKLTLLDKIIRLYELVYGENLNYHHALVGKIHRIKATYLVEMERYEEALDELEKMCDHSIKSSLSKAGDRFTSAFTNRLSQPDPSDKFEYYTSHNDAYYTVQKMQGSRYDPIREMPHFKAIEEKLESVAQ